MDDRHVRIEHDELLLGPVRIGFQRTLRIPEAGLHPLPPGLGRFPLRRVQDYPDTAPAEWLARGGVMLPVYQREAMWLSFDADEPAALQVGAGKVCAISGGPWQDKLTRSPQNYAPLPEQPWLDGINAGEGFIRQFVAVPLGSGATVEGQITGEEVHGGVQLRAVGLAAQALASWRAHVAPFGALTSELHCMVAPPDMGLGAGGRMRQEVYRDERPLRDYDDDRSWRVFVHLCSAAQWTAVTGEVPPPTPIDRDAYVKAGLPWFDYYDDDRDDLPASSALAGVESVSAVLGGEEPPFQPVHPVDVVTLNHSGGDIVPDQDW